jgi:hypothetical protein
MDSRAHRELDVWKRSMEFVQGIYQVTEAFPKAELYTVSHLRCEEPPCLFQVIWLRVLRVKAIKSSSNI